MTMKTQWYKEKAGIVVGFIDEGIIETYTYDKAVDEMELNEFYGLEIEVPENAVLKINHNFDGQFDAHTVWSDFWIIGGAYYNGFRYYYDEPPFNSSIQFFTPKNGLTPIFYDTPEEAEENSTKTITYDPAIEGFDTIKIGILFKRPFKRKRRFVFES